ncbi:MAG: DUF3592 domain-containing protein [Longimicrobiales bacterium]
MSTYPPGLYPRWRRLAGSLFLLLFGAVFLYFMVPEIRSNFAALNWTSTSCTILSSGMDTQAHRDPLEDDLARVRVSYSYQVAGQRFESNRFRFVDVYTNDLTAMQRTVARLQPGAVVSCYFDPERPANAVLDARVSPFMLAALLPLTFVFFGIWGLASLGLEVLPTRS